MKMKHKHLTLLFAGFIALAVFVAVDNLVPRLDWAYINWHGWLAFFYYLIPWTLLLLSPALLFGRQARWFYVLFIPILSAIEVVTMFVRVNFKVQMDGAWLPIVLGSSWGEIVDFISQYFGVAFVLVGLSIIAFDTIAIKVMRDLCRVGQKDSGRIRMGLGVSCLIIFVLMTQAWEAPLKTFESRSSVLFATDAFRAFSNYRKLIAMKNAPQLPACHRCERVDKSVLGLVVVGESATRNRWHLYGYERETTPCMDAIKDELIIFSDVQAAELNTAREMPLVLTTATLKRPDDFRYAFPQLLQSCGYETTLLSAQERMGVVGGTETYAFAGCEEMMFLCEAGGSSIYDDALLPYLWRFSETKLSQKPKVAFLHLMGSHQCPAHRYPADFMPFDAEPITTYRQWSNMKLLSPHYDNSIAFTDRLLNDIITGLKRRNAPSWLIYFSDHGESPNDKEWRLATSHDTWEVPMIVWLSPQYREQFPEVAASLEELSKKQLCLDRLLPILEQLANIIPDKGK